MEDDVLRKLGAPLARAARARARLPVRSSAGAGWPARRRCCSRGWWSSGRDCEPAAGPQRRRSRVGQAGARRCPGARRRHHRPRPQAADHHRASMPRWTHRRSAAAFRLQPDTAVTLHAGMTPARVLTIMPLRHWEPHTLVRRSRSPRPRGLPTVVAWHRRALGRSSLPAPGVEHRGDPRGRQSGPERLGLPHHVLDQPASIAAVTALRSEPELQCRSRPGPRAASSCSPRRRRSPPMRRYRMSLDGLAGADGVAVRQPDRAGDPGRGGPGGRPVLSAHGRGRCRAHQRDLRPVHGTDEPRADGRRVPVTSANGAAVKGAVTWAEQGTVLVFVPAAALPYSATVRMTVDASALSRAGARRCSGRRAPSRSRPSPPKPKAAPAHRHPHPRSPSPSPSRSATRGGAPVRGSWSGVETYYLRLMNCTRTGGWVTSVGQLLVAGRARRRAAGAQLRHQLPGLTPVREAAGHPQHLRPLRGREPR